MKFRLAALAVLLGATSFACAQPINLSISPTESSANFSVKHLDIARVQGQFSHITGSIVLNTHHMSRSSVQATIPVKTIDTGVSMRDHDLRGADFFNVAKFPTMTFKSTSVKPDKGGYKVVGNLTMHGVTRPVTLQMQPPSKPVSFHGATFRGFEATTTLNRRNFNLKWNGMLPDGNAMIGNKIRITLNIEASQKK